MTDPCENCPLGATRAVASRGPVPARVLLLTGAPRHHEEHEGVAFASPLFPWLEEQLAAAGIDPAAVHYATLTGCRPPHQRPLRPAEIAACARRLDLTIAAVAPRVIALCGPDVVTALLPDVSPGTAHGTLVRRGRRRYYPLRHPYAAPHSERYVAELEEDLRRLAALIEGDWPDEGDGVQRVDGRDDAHDVQDAVVGGDTPLAVVASTTRAPEPVGATAPSPAPHDATAALSLTGAGGAPPLMSTDGAAARPDSPTISAGDDGDGYTAVETGADGAASAAATTGAVATEEEDGPTQLSLF